MQYLYTIAITKGKLAVVGPIIHILLNANFKSKKIVEILWVFLPSQIAWNWIPIT